MPQINLLKQAPVNHTQTASKVVEWVLLVVLLGLLIYYAVINIQLKQTNDGIASKQTAISQDTQTALTTPGREELITRQQQLKNLATLISSHIYFSQLLPKLAESTLNSAAYSDLEIPGDGTLTLTATVPSLEDLDTYLQVFNLPQVNQYFSNVRISSFSKVQNLTSTSIKFQVIMNYDPSIIAYSSSSNSNP